jgi:hypothetical protein
MRKGYNFIRIYREYKFDTSYRYYFPLSYPQYYEEWQAIEIVNNDYKSGDFVERKLYYKQMRVTEPSERTESLLSFEDLEKRREIPVDPDNCDWYKKYKEQEEKIEKEIKGKPFITQKELEIIEKNETIIYCHCGKEMIPIINQCPDENCKYNLMDVKRSLWNKT